MRPLAFLAAALCLAPPPALAQAQGQTANAERDAAIKVMSDQWVLFAGQRAVAGRCPIARPDRLRVLTTGLAVREQALRNAGQRPDWDLGRAKLRDQADTVPCDGEMAKGYAAQIDDSYGAILMQTAGWYALRDAPCGALKVEPVDVRPIVEAIARQKPDLAGKLWANWQAAPQAERDARCQNNRIAENDVELMLASLALDAKQPAYAYISLIYPLGEITGHLTARRSQDGAKVRPETLPVEASISQYDNINGLLAYTLDGKLIGRIEPRTPGQTASGVELQFFETRWAAQPYKTIKPARELAKIPYFRTGAGVADTRTWQFGPDAEAEIAKAAPGVYLTLRQDAVGGVKDERKPWITEEVERSFVRVNLADLRAARSWATTSGPVGSPFKP